MGPLFTADGAGGFGVLSLTGLAFPSSGLGQSPASPRTICVPLIVLSDLRPKPNQAIYFAKSLPKDCCHSLQGWGKGKNKLLAQANKAQAS